MRLKPVAAGAVTALGTQLLIAHLLGAPQYGAWTAPVNLGAPVNSAYAETKATLSKDGLSLYFSSNRPCGDEDVLLDANVWVARRAAADQAWTTASVECLDINVNPKAAGETPYEDSAPTLSRDEHWLYFVSDRFGSFGSPGFFGRDIWASWRPDVHDDQSWTTPFRLDAPVNTTAAETGPAYFENEGGIPELFFISTRSALPGLFDVWRIGIVDGLPAGAAARVDEVSTSADVEAGVSIRHDGLELFFFRGAPGAIFDIYASSRPDTASPWSEPVNLGAPVNTAANEQGPSISPSRMELYIASTRSGSTPGPSGGPSLDIWVASRTK